MEVGSLAPPSVQLVPAKRYNGAPIGTSYDVRVHLGKRTTCCVLMSMPTLPAQQQCGIETLLHTNTYKLTLCDCLINKTTFPLLSFRFSEWPLNLISADQVEERFSRRSMVRLGVRVIHKVSSEAKPQPIVATIPNTLSKTLRLRLSPKALKISNKLASNTDENSHLTINYGSDGSSVGCDTSGAIISRVDMKKRSLSSENRQLHSTKVSAPNEW